MSGARILIVEDEFIVAHDMRTTLERQGYEVCGMVSTGEEAVALAESERPHCILMDMSIRGAMSGLEAARRIRSRSRASIVFVTGQPVTDVTRQTRGLEPVTCLAKPVDLTELCEVIERLAAERAVDETVDESSGTQRTAQCDSDHPPGARAAGGEQTRPRPASHTRRRTPWPP